ncbi:MAG: signal peptidase I [Acidimicrobiaceae bacterium]|nr:signal peptidase I [Acidimicrobiaceae bacterium]
MNQLPESSSPEEQNASNLTSEGSQEPSINDGSANVATDKDQPSEDGSANPAGVRRHRSASRTRRSRVIKEWTILVVVAAVVALLVRAFVFQAFFIPSGSMLPTLQIGDRILVDKLSYDFHKVNRGDMVVFRTPPADTGDPGIKDLVKRVIGLPGDRISSSGGSVYIDGKKLAEPWLPYGTKTFGITTQTVPAGDIFVMGDNRGNSKDSRVFGPISEKLIVGRVSLIFYPLSQFHLYW